MITKNYNIITKSIDSGLTSEPIGTAGGYIALLSAPTNANVKIHLNDRNADGIPLKTYHAIEATGIEQIFVSADAVAGETIEIVQASNSKDFKMITPASDVNVDSINEILDRFRPNGTAIQQTIPVAVAQIDDITIVNAVDANVYAVSVDGTVYSYTAGASSTLATIADGLGALIPNGVSDGVSVVTVTAVTAGVAQIVTIDSTTTIETDITITNITANVVPSYIFTKTNEIMIRFHCTDETGVELDNNTIKYPMFEEELRVDNLSTVKFYNDTEADIVLTIWIM